ncbi:hypothetical protein GCM10009096_04230 [Parasphingorhabdus litoris]|uniref:Uncharacterized protein n=1 Tax=Parasphingorhabdus litoris TaxID=394733 RepID=A0ABP3JXU0_9SPHN|nr:hypothetical protein [Parasphingorhabdus litoris]
MSNSNKIDILKLIEELGDILALLDKTDHSIAAIKVEEAIDALKQVADDNRGD